jgi:hypothetical protein
MPTLLAFGAGPGGNVAILLGDGVRLYDCAQIVQLIEPEDPGNSDLWTIAIDETDEHAMPPACQPQLTPEQEHLSYTWIMQGARNNSYVGCDASNVTCTGMIQPLFQKASNGCHSSSIPHDGLDLSDHTTYFTEAMDGRLAGAVQHQATSTAIPSSVGMLLQCGIDVIPVRIEAGIPNN